VVRSWDPAARKICYSLAVVELLPSLHPRPTLLHGCGCPAILHIALTAYGVGDKSLDSGRRMERGGTE